MKIVINDHNILSDIKGLKISDNTLTFNDFSSGVILLENGEANLQEVNINVISGNVKLLTNNLGANLNIKLSHNTCLTLTELNFNASDKLHKVKILENATFNHTIIATTHHNLNLNVDLDGFNASSFIDCLVISDDSKSDINTLINHNAKNTKSSVKNHAISLTNGYINFKTSAKVNHGCIKSVCSQLTKGIILGDNGVIKSTPILLIDENDIEASHGSSIGKASDDSLFYLMSRGLSKSEALKLIIMGLINPFVQSILNESLKEKLVDNLGHILER